VIHDEKIENRIATQKPSNMNGMNFSRGAGVKSFEVSLSIMSAELGSLLMIFIFVKAFIS
jgi:hypothetical protein